MAAALAAAAGYCGGCWLLSGLLLGPHRSAQTTTPPGIDEQAFELLARDGTTIAGVRVDPAGLSRGNVAVFHGLEGARPYAKLRLLAQAGLRGFAIDFRAHGKSGGERSTFGWEERWDAGALLDFIRSEFPGEPLSAWGESLGSAALLYLGDERGDLAALVLECPYADIETAYWNRVDMFAPAWLRFVGYGPKWVIERRLGIDPALLRPVDYAAALDPERVFLARGALDRRVTAVEFEGFARVNPGLKLRTVPGVNHWLFPQSGEPYRSAVLAFLSAASEAASGAPAGLRGSR